MIEFLAQAGATQPTGNEGPLFSILHQPSLVFILILLGVMYFVMILPKRNQDKKRRQMLDEMKRGDEIQTIGGIIGKVVEPREDRVLVKVDESSNTKIWFSRSAIARVTAEESKATTPAK